MTRTPEGWYPNPHKPGWLLYWDGFSWTKQERRETDEERRAKIVCQFCQQAGGVTVRNERRAKRKTATRMLFGAATMGGSLAVTGVSKKGTVTVLHCSTCGMSWDAPQTTF